MEVQEATVEETIRMSKKERNWLIELRQVWEGKQSIRDAQAKLGGSYRQARRRFRRFIEKGDAGLCHMSRGRPSNRAKPPEIREAMVGLYREKLMGWGPTQAAEQLGEWGYEAGGETLRRWLLAAGLWTRHRDRAAHRKRRERREHFGELVQMDGSFHPWLPGLQKALCLMVMVDDATGTKLARFYEQETTFAAMEMLKLWAGRYGVPCALYTDRKDVYVLCEKDARRATERGEEPLTQFGKACARLGVKVIAAHSPQAKGRVERANGMLQDRLVKQLALHNIKTIEEANAFLEGGYMDKLNEKFARPPASKANYHRAKPEERELFEALSAEDTRTVANDWTVRHGNKSYQILAGNTNLPPAKGQVTVQKRLDGSLHILYRGMEVAYEEITEKPKETALQQTAMAPKPFRRKSRWVPPENHPWRLAARQAAAPPRQTAQRRP